MAHQINLYSPILLVPRCHFSARAMLQAAAVLALGLAALGGWSAYSTQRLKADVASTADANEQEKLRLEAQIAGRAPAPKDTAALEQELVQMRKGLAERRQILAELDASGGNAGLLRLIAQTAPPSLWLTEVKRVEGRVELAGVMLQPEALRPWMQQLAAHPALAGQPLRAVRVERSDDEGAGGAEAWSFRVSGGRAPGDTP